MMARSMLWLSDPNLAILLILCGILLIYAECNRPGTVLPGCAGALAAMLGFWGLEHATVSLPYLALVATGIATIAVGCALPLRGLTAFAGGACLCWGLASLTKPPVHMSIAVAVTVIFSSVTRWLGRVALLARRKKRVPGPWDRGWGGRASLGRVD